MCGGSDVEDNSDEVARIEAAERRYEREQEARRLRKEEQRFKQSLTGAYQTGQTGIQDYFMGRGVDPSAYEAAISQALNETKMMVPHLDSSPYTYFNGLGQQVYDRETDKYRFSLQDQIDELAPKNFASSRITDQADDELIAALLDTKFNEAKQYGDNLRARGVINDLGYSAGLAGLEDQRSGAGSTLQDLGLAILGQGRSALDKIAGNARETAAAAKLGSDFDVSGYGTQLEGTLSDFFGNLEGKLKTVAPSDLFDKNIFATKGGVAQGAGNTAFDPSALAGIFDQQPKKKKEEDDIFADAGSVF